VKEDNKKCQEIRAGSENTFMELGVGHAALAHAFSALCLCAFATLCHKKPLRL
jgi:hypothetical protein